MNGRLAFSAFILGLALPLLSLPIFAIGYWDKAEPIIIGLHLTSSLAILALAARAWSSLAAVMAAFRHPVVVIPLALGLFSLFVAPFVERPLLSLLGPLQSGYGGLWQLETAILIATARLLRSESPQKWWFLIRFAMATVGATALIKLLDAQLGSENLLIWIPAYYAWLGLGLAGLALEAKDRSWRIAILSAAILVLLSSRSLAAIIFAALGVGTWLVWRHEGIKSRPLAVMLTMLAAVGPLLVTGFFSPSWQVASLADRHSLLRMVWAFVSEAEWGFWLIGAGWGQAQEIFQIKLLASGMNLWDGGWIFMSSDYFHSHNAIIEGLLGAGLPGAFALLAWPVAIAFYAPKKRQAVAAGFAFSIAGLGALWFPLGLSLPMIAMTAAALTSEPEPTANIGSKGIAAGLALIAIGLLTWAGILVNFGREVLLVRQSWKSFSSLPLPLPSDPRGSDLMAARMIRDALAHMETITDPNEREKARPVARLLYASLRERMPTASTVLLPIASLTMMAGVRVTRKLAWLEQDIPNIGENWAFSLERALALAPSRSDLAIPFLGQMAVHGPLSALYNGAQSILDRDPNDPVGLYFMGVWQVQQPNSLAKKAGLASIRASIENGLERLMPIDPELVAILAKEQ
jgi:hypothetical protein